MTSEVGLSWLAICAAMDVDRVSLGKGAEVDVDRYLEPFKDWLLGASRILRRSIADNRFPVLQEELQVVSKALGYDIYRPNRGDTIGSIFPKLYSQLTENLCTLQAICHDSSGVFDANDLRALRAFCVALSTSASMLGYSQRARLVA